MRILMLDWMTGIYIEQSDYGGWLFASIIVFSSWLICYHSIKYYQLLLDQRAIAAEARDQAQLETVRRLQAEAQSRDAQLKMLKYQLNPHFLFNALNSITALVRIGDKGAAEETVSRLAEFLRVILDHNDELDHTLEEEIKNLELYLGIEKVRFEDRLRVRMELTPRAKAALVPSLLLQPLFENAIKHAVGKSLAATTVSLSARTFAGPTGDERLELIVADTGPNWSSAELELAPKGIGLTNTKQRLDSYFGGSYSFELLRNEPQGLSIRIEIPFLLGHAFSRTTLAAGKTSGQSAPSPTDASAAHDPLAAE
jgi:LytS/YehU family sensor histidine kinase